MKPEWNWRWWMYPVMAIAVGLLAVSAVYDGQIPYVWIGYPIGMALVVAVVTKARGQEYWGIWPRKRPEDERYY